MPTETIFARGGAKARVGKPGSARPKKSTGVIKGAPPREKGM
jgi:hypothetical protein